MLLMFKPAIVKLWFLRIKQNIQHSEHPCYSKNVIYDICNLEEFWKIPFTQ